MNFTWVARVGLFPRSAKTGCSPWERQFVFKIRPVTAPRADFSCEVHPYCLFVTVIQSSGGVGRTFLIHIIADLGKRPTRANRTGWKSCVRAGHKPGPVSRRGYPSSGQWPFI